MTTWQSLTGGLLSANMRGILLMIAATMLLTSMSSIVRIIAEDMHPFQVAFMRNFFGLILLLPILARQGLAPLLQSGADGGTRLF